MHSLCINNYILIVYGRFKIQNLVHVLTSVVKEINFAANNRIIMKLKLLIIAALSLSSMCGFAQSNTTGGSSTGTSSGFSSGDIITIHPKIGTKGRNKAPSAQQVEARYEDGYMYLNFKYSEGSAVLYIYSADQITLRSQTVFNTDSEAAVYVGDLSEAYLLIATSNGHEYEGWIY